MGETHRRLRGWRGIALALAVVTTGAAHASFDTSNRISGGRFTVPDADSARFLSFGFDAVVADYYWLRVLELVGAEMGKIEQHGAVIGDSIDLITTLDPWVDHPYRFAALWLTADAATIERSNTLLERGISYHPLEWRNRYHLGFNRFFYLEDHLGAAEVLESAVGLEGAPKYLTALVARLRAQLGGLDIAATFLRSAVDEAADEFARAEFLKALDEIEVERAARFLDAAREEFWRRHGRDIERVSDLTTGPAPVLQALPPAQMHLPGFEWMLEPETRQIVSSYYRHRYELHVTKTDRARQERWRARAEGRS